MGAFFHKRTPVHVDSLMSIFGVNSCDRLNYVPPKKICWRPNPQYLRIWPYSGMGCIRCNQVKMRSLGWSLIRYDWCPYKKKEGGFGHRVRYIGRTPYEDESRGWGDASKRQGMPKIGSKPLEAERQAWNRFSLLAPRRNQPCGHLAPRLRASRAGRQAFLVRFQLVELCCSPSKQIQSAVLSSLLGIWGDIK